MIKNEIFSDEIRGVVDFLGLNWGFLFEERSVEVKNKVGLIHI